MLLLPGNVPEACDKSEISQWGRSFLACESQKTPSPFDLRHQEDIGRSESLQWLWLFLYYQDSGSSGR